MPAFQELFAEVLRQRPDVGEATLRRLVEEKKSRVGAGYLTDQGSLYLVAADLGVILAPITATDLTLRDLFVGANEITVTARVFALYPLRTYVRRDGTQAQYRRLVLFDGPTLVGATLWAEKALLVAELGLDVDHVVRVVKGYVKAGLDGNPVLHVGTRGTIEHVVEGQLARPLPAVEQVARRVDEVRGAGGPFAVVGVIRGPAKTSEFVRSDGRPGRVTQLYLGSDAGSRMTRVALWDTNPQPYLAAPPHAEVRLVNVRARQLPHGEVELHGDEGTRLQILRMPVQPAPPLPPPSPRPDVRILRVLSVGPSSERLDGVTSASLLVTDVGANLFTLIVRGRAYEQVAAAGPEAVLECPVRELSAGVLVCDSPSGIQSVAGPPTGMPGIERFTRKLRDLGEAGMPVFVEVIALTRSSSTEVTTKDGTVVKKAEVTVGDETGEVKVVGWRGLASALDGIRPGDRLRLKGLLVQRGRTEGHELLVRAYSAIESVD